MAFAIVYTNSVRSQSNNKKDHRGFVPEGPRITAGPAPFKRGEWVRFKDDETGDTSLKFEVFDVTFDDFSWRITTRYGYGQPSMWFVKCDPPQQA